MSTDFYNAFYRHATDADLLLDKERWANADHHYGLAAECALKAILLQQGISSKGGDIADPKYKQHIDKLWDKYQSFMQKKIHTFFRRETRFMTGALTSAMPMKTILRNRPREIMAQLSPH